MITFSVTDMDTWSSGWKVVILSGWIPLIISEIFLKTYIYKTHLPQILAALSNSSCIQHAALLVKTKGPVAKSIFISFIYGAIKNPKDLEKNGMLSSSDIKNFPRNLRRLLSVTSSLAYIAICWVLTIYVLGLISGHSSN